MEGQTVLTVTQRGTDPARREMAGRTLTLIPRNGTGPASGTPGKRFSGRLAAALMLLSPLGGLGVNMPCGQPEGPALTELR